MKTHRLTNLLPLLGFVASWSFTAHAQLQEVPQQDPQPEVTAPDAPPAPAPALAPLPPAPPPAAVAPPAPPPQAPAAAPAPRGTYGYGTSFDSFRSLPPSGAEAPAVQGKSSGPRMVFGATAGYVIGYLSHPVLVRTAFDGPMLELHVGVAVHPAWTVAFEVTSIEVEVRRETAGLAPRGEIVGSSLRIQAGATRTPASLASANGLGGDPFEYPVTHLHTVGPRVEFTPSGEDGLYVGLTAGASVVQDLPGRIGGAAAARGGYRVRLADVISFSFEAGAHGHLYKDGSAGFPFAGVQMRLFLAGFGK